MIRKLQKADINRVANIWLDTNLKAHYFISEQYWKEEVIGFHLAVFLFEDKLFLH